MIKMNEAREMKIADKMYVGYNQKKESTKAVPKTRRTRNCRTKAVDELINFGSCPCSVDEVYSLGISLQYYIGDIYLDLEATQGPQKFLYKKLALNQLDIKEEIAKLANANLNQLLCYFYNNGGPIIEAPVSEEMAKEIQPFFNRIAVNFMNQLDVIVSMASKGNMDPSELESAINNNIIAMYTTMRKLFQVDEIENAFNELISIRKALSN